MSNSKNLVPLTKRSPEEALELRRKGAAAVNEMHRKRKTMAEVAKEMMNAKIDKRQKDYIAKLDEMGFEGEKCSYLSAVIRQVFAILMDDSIVPTDRLKAAELLRKLTDGDAYAVTLNTEVPIETKVAQLLKQQD